MFGAIVPLPQSYNISQFDWEEQNDLDLSIEDTVREWIFSNPPSYCNPNINRDLPEWSQNNFRWKREFTFDEAAKMTSKGKDLGNILDIEILNGELRAEHISQNLFLRKNALK